MNIFFVDKHPGIAATMLCDKHIVKMVTESAQILCAVQHRIGNDNKELYKDPKGNKKPVEWAMKSAQNYQWLLDHWVVLSLEYWKRYHKYMKSGAIVENIYTKEFGTWNPSRLFILLNTAFLLPDIGLTVPECSTKDIILNDPADTWEKVVENYRFYYKKDKAGFAKWNNGVAAPYWWG